MAQSPGWNRLGSGRLFKEGTLRRLAHFLLAVPLLAIPGTVLGQSFERDPRLSAMRAVLVTAGSAELPPVPFVACSVTLRAGAAVVHQLMRDRYASIGDSSATAGECSLHMEGVAGKPARFVNEIKVKGKSARVTATVRNGEWHWQESYDVTVDEFTAWVVSRKQWEFIRASPRPPLSASTPWCAPHDDTHWAGLLGYLKYGSNAPDSWAVRFRTSIRLPSVDSSEIVPVTDERRCEIAAATLTALVQGQPGMRRKMYLVRVGSAYWAEDRSEMAGEYIRALVLDRSLKTILGVPGR